MSPSKKAQINNKQILLSAIRGEGSEERKKFFKAQQSLLNDKTIPQHIQASALPFFPDKKKQDEKAKEFYDMITSLQVKKKVEPLTKNAI